MSSLWLAYCKRNVSYVIGHIIRVKDFSHSGVVLNIMILSICRYRKVDFEKQHSKRQTKTHRKFNKHIELRSVEKKFPIQIDFVCKYSTKKRIQVVFRFDIVWSHHRYDKYLRLSHNDYSLSCFFNGWFVYCRCVILLSHLSSFHLDDVKVLFMLKWCHIISRPLFHFISLQHHVIVVCVVRFCFCVCWKFVRALQFVVHDDAMAYQLDAIIASRNVPSSSSSSFILSCIWLYAIFYDTPEVNSLYDCISHCIANIVFYCFSVLLLSLALFVTLGKPAFLRSIFNQALLNTHDQNIYANELLK